MVISINNKRISKAAARAKIAYEFCFIPLEKDFFELSWFELDKVQALRELFNFSGKNTLGRSVNRQFYYHLQKGFAELKKENFIKIVKDSPF